MVFLAAGIPAMQFNHWPDNFYHSSADTAEMADPTEGKRIGFVGAAAFYYLATAGPAEAKALAWESSANGSKWITEVARQSVRLIAGDTDTLPARYAAAQNKVAGAWQRGRGGIESVQKVAVGCGRGVDGEDRWSRAWTPCVPPRRRNSKRCSRSAPQALGMQAVVPPLSARAQELALLIPKKTFGAFSAEAQKLAAATGGRGGGGPATGAGRAAAAPADGPAAGCRHSKCRGSSTGRAASSTSTTPCAPSTATRRRQRRLQVRVGRSASSTRTSTWRPSPPPSRTWRRRGRWKSARSSRNRRRRRSEDSEASADSDRLARLRGAG